MQFDIFDQQLKAGIQSRLRNFGIIELVNPDLRDAAVAIVLAPEPTTGEPSVLLTRRPSDLRRHPGQYALPGGRLDDDETATDAALRELHEEVGLDLNPADVLGRLDDYETRSGFRISPFVIWCTNKTALKPDPTEVEAVFHIPFSELNDPKIPQLLNGGNSARPMLSAYIPTLGHEVFAPTGAILFQFREIALRGVTTRVSHFEEPSFAWK